jgi:hypothetical protein
MVLWFTIYCFVPGEFLIVMDLPFFLGCQPGSIGANSCQGISSSDACFAAAAKYIAPNSCNGKDACFGANSGEENIGFRLTDGPFVRTAVVGTTDPYPDGNSCNGVQACYKAKTLIGAAACVGEPPADDIKGVCEYVEFTQISDGSCRGEQACFKGGREGDVVGIESCIGRRSCILTA